MRSYSYRFMAISIALALGLNGGLSVLAEALSTEMVDIQDQVSEYVDEDEVNQEVHEISEEEKAHITMVDELSSVEENKSVASATVPEATQSSIYAKGIPLILVAGNSSEIYTVIYIDENKNGMVDEDIDTIWAPTGKDKTIKGNSLTLYSIFGGDKTDSLTGNTSITMLGGKVKGIYGGSHGGIVRGDTHVTISGGIVDSDVYGGGYNESVNGNTNVSMDGGSVRNLYGGGSTDDAVVSDNTNIIVSGGKVLNIFGCGAYGKVGKNVNISVLDGMISDSVYGGTLDLREPINCNVDISIKGGTVEKNIYTSGNMPSNTLTGVKRVTVGGNTKIGSVSDKTGIVINDSQNKAGADSFIIDPNLEADASIHINLDKGFSELNGNSIVATSADVGDIEKVTLVGTNAPKLKLYYDGYDKTIKLGNKAIINSVTVTPNPAVVPLNGQMEFEALVEGTGNPAQTVTWSVSDGGPGTKIDKDGLLIIAANETANTLTVKATSTEDTKKSATATVKVRKLTNIEIHTEPIKTSYIEGENFDKAGMVVVANYSEGSDFVEEKITEYTISPNKSLNITDKSVTVSFTDCGVTMTTSQPITVSKKTPTNPTITPTSAIFDKYTSALGYVDIEVTQTLNGNTLSAIRKGEELLKSSVDYNISGNTITIKKEYLGQQPTGTTRLTFDYNVEISPTLEITVLDSTPSPIHKPVTAITDAPSLAISGIDLILTGTVFPADATNKSIEWSVKSAGTTGAVITNNSLKATTEGIVEVRATITNGLTESINYIQDFAIEVNAPDAAIHTVTIDENGGIGASGSGDYAVGTIVTLTAGTKDGNYSFGSWSLTGATAISINKNSVTFKMPANEVTAEINWIYTGSDGSISPTPKPPVITDPALPENGNVNMKPSVDKNGNATVSVVDRDIEKAIQEAEKQAKKNGTEKNGISVSVTIDASKTFSLYTVNFPKTTQEILIKAEVKRFTIKGGANITFDLEAVKQINSIVNDDVTVTVAKTINTHLSETQAATGGRPVYNFKVTGGGKDITAFGNGKLLLTIPYEPQRVDDNGKVSKNGRYEQTSQLIGVYLDEQGKRHELLDSYYDNTSKKLIIHTNHLSTYGVAYKTTSSNLTDITNHWAKEEINFVVARGLLTGTNNQFLPDGLISRGEFVAALAKLANADLSIYKTASFTDCPINNPYFGAVEWATQYKLIDGAGNGLFAPSSPISRQTMALVLSNYARVMGYTLPSAQKEITFLDQALISSWAKSSVKDLQMAGIVISKKNGNFDPLTSATRAETAMMLSRYIQANTSDGWKMNDCGEWMYFKNGQYLTGSRSIEGLTYKFDQYGVTQSLPKEKRYVLYIVQKGDTLRTLAKKHELSVTELAIFNQLKTSDTLLFGDEIRIPKK